MSDTEDDWYNNFGSEGHAVKLDNDNYLSVWTMANDKNYYSGLANGCYKISSSELSYLMVLQNMVVFITVWKIN